jgi:hypothetical protein
MMSISRMEAQNRLDIFRDVPTVSDLNLPALDEVARDLTFFGSLSLSFATARSSASSILSPQTSSGSASV